MSPPQSARRVLYLHGFASGPGSRKGRAYEAYLVARGFDVARLDLRVPDRDRLRISRMIAAVEEAVGAGPVALIGSSLGGLVAAHVAAARPEVLGCVLMAPAFFFAERWSASLDAERLARWRAGEPLEVTDHTGGPPLRVDHGFYEDAIAVVAEPPRVSQPVLVFHGVHDETVDIAGSRRWLESVAPSQGASLWPLVELDDGHTLERSLPIMLPRAHEFLEQLWRDDT